MRTRIYLNTPDQGQVSPGVCELDSPPPMTMRLVQDEITGQWDALDLKEDRPLNSETMYLGERSSHGNMCQRGNDGYSGPFVIYDVGENIS